MTITEALKAVPHSVDCYESDDCPCTCDREDRIAKGIEAAFGAVGEDWPLRWEDDAIAAFTRAASL